MSQDTPMRQIALTRGMVALVSDEDYERLSRWKWYAQRGGRGHWYAACAAKRVLMHREILQCEEEVDHINGDGLDNRRENLRPATRVQNCRNQRKRKTKTSSQFKGVCWVKRKSKWRAAIRVNGKRVYLDYLGCFRDGTEAARAYDAAARLHFGEFACGNFFAEVL